MYRSLGDGQILPTFALARPLRAGMVHLSRIDRRYLFDAKATPTHPDRARRPARVMQWQRYCGGGYWQRKWGTKLRWRTDHFDRRCSSRRWCSIRDARSCHRHHSSDRTRGERHRARSDKLCWQIPVRRGLWCFLERTPNGQSGKPEDRDRRLRTGGPSAPIATYLGKVGSWGCQVHNCGDHQWAVLVDPRTGETDVCYHNAAKVRGKSRWFLANGAEEIRPGNCAVV